jgi:Leucine-rich repeat (LRR) protein
LSDLQWLEPVISTLKLLLVTLPEGKIDPTRISECTELRELSFSVWPTRILDFSQLRKLESLSMIWTRHKYINLEALTSLKSLGIDLPPEDLTFLKTMVRLEDLSFTAARRIRSVPEVGNPSGIEILAVHGSPEFSLDGLSTFPNLRILDLDHIKRISDSASLTNCIHLEELLLEECGPRIEPDAIQALRLNRLFICGRRLPFEGQEIRNLAVVGIPQFTAPPRFMPS